MRQLLLVFFMLCFGFSHAQSVRLLPPDSLDSRQRFGSNLYADDEYLYVQSYFSSKGRVDAYDKQTLSYVDSLYEDFSSSYGRAITHYNDLLFVFAPGNWFSPAHVFVYRKVNGDFVLEADLLHQSESINASHLMAYSLTCDDSTLFVGNNTINKVYLYDRNWALRDSLEGRHDLGGDRFGFLVERHGDSLYVASDDYLYVYESVGDFSWEKVDSVGVFSPSTRFHYGLDFMDNFIIIGGLDNYTKQYVHVITKDDYELVKTFDGLGIISGGLYGNIMSVKGNQVLMGAPFYSQAYENKAFLYAYKHGQWLLQDEFAGTYPNRFGVSVLLDSNKIYIGAPFEDTEVGANSGALYVYENAYEDFELDFYVRHDESLRQLPYDGSLQVCADGSDATEIYVTHTDVSLVELSIREGSDSLKYGKFVKEMINDSLAKFVYRHPGIVYENFGLFRTLTLDVHFDGQLIDEYFIDVYRAPVVMVHGLWARPKSFDMLNGNLIGELWPDELTYQVNYTSTNASEFEVNLDILELQIDSFFKSLIRDGHSCGKVSLVGHSMGCALSRLYYQDEERRKKVMRFIALNGAHAGSQSANLLLEPESYLVALALEAIGKGVYSGALFDLQVDGYNVNYWLNDPYKLSLSVPSHVISSYTNFSRYDPTGTNILVRMLSKNYVITPDSLLHVLFGEESDLVIPFSGQNGGLDAITTYTDFGHSDVLGDSLAIEWIVDLLNANLGSGLFDDNGFSPPVLDYEFGIFGGSVSEMTQSVSLLNFDDGDEVLAGDEIVLEISGSDSVMSVHVIGGNRDVDARLVSAQGLGSFSVLYEFPFDTYGKYGLCVFGLASDSSIVAMDSVFVQVGSSFSLDSISVSDSLFVYADSGMVGLDIIGHFSDGSVRSVVLSNDLEVTVLDESVGSYLGDGLIVGLREGETAVSVEIDGLVAMCGLQIMVRDVVLGVNSGSGDSFGDDDNEVVSDDFMLFANYPNPFNGETVIEFSLFEKNHVRLDVYNVLGQKVVSLVDGVRNDGRHRVVWDAKNSYDDEVSSGIYFYKVSVGGYTQVKKMLFVK